MAEPVLIRVRGQELPCDSPLDQMLVQGDKNAQVIQFVMDKTVNGVDISTDVSYAINGLNSQGQAATGGLSKSEGRDPDTFTLTWTVGDQFTYEDGRLILWITATRSTDDSEVVFNWQTKPKEVFVRKGFLTGEYIGVTEQLLIDIAGMLGRAEQAASNSEASAVDSARSATAAAGSAREAAASEAGAAQSEARAKQSEEAARESELNAANSAQAASANAADAKLYADNAKQFANNAAASAVAAKTSAVAAAVSEQNAYDSMLAADESATDAAESAQTAFEQAQAAAIQVLTTWTVLRDPTTGQFDTVQNIVNNLFALHTDALMAQEYDDLDMTAAYYDGKGLTAYQYDTAGKALLP